MDNDNEIYQTITYKPNVDVVEMTSSSSKDEIIDEEKAKSKEMKEAAKVLAKGVAHKTKVKTIQAFKWANKSRKKANAVTGLAIAKTFGRRTAMYKDISKEIKDIVEYSETNGIDSGKEELQKINQKILNLDPETLKPNEYALLLQEIAKYYQKLSYKEVINRVEGGRHGN